MYLIKDQKNFFLTVKFFPSGLAWNHPTVAGAGSSLICSSESTGTGWGGVDEIQNKAEAQPAWLQLAPGAAARA